MQYYIYTTNYNDSNKDSNDIDGNNNKRNNDNDDHHDNNIDNNNDYKDKDNFVLLLKRAHSYTPALMQGSKLTPGGEWPKWINVLHDTFTYCHFTSMLKTKEETLN